MNLGEVVHGLIPPPEKLVLKTPIDKISFDLKRPLLQFYKDEAKKLDVPYSRLMRAVLQNYASQIARQNAGDDGK